MTTPAEEAQDLYTNQLKPQAVKEARTYIMDRTPSRLWDEMKAIVDADIADSIPPEPDPLVAQVANGQPVIVNAIAGTPQPGSPGTATVANSALTVVTLGPIPP